jgi:hypothetical protein
LVFQILQVKFWMCNTEQDATSFHNKSFNLNCWTSKEHGWHLPQSYPFKRYKLSRSLLWDQMVHLQNEHGKRSCSGDLKTLNPCRKVKLIVIHIYFFSALHQFLFSHSYFSSSCIIILLLACSLFCISIALENKINICLLCCIINYKPHVNNFVAWTYRNIHCGGIK